MLNIKLYNALKVAFGPVRIENEDVPAAIIRDRVTPFSTSWRLSKDNEYGDHGEQYRVNCPICNDKKQHLYISYLSCTAPVVDGITLSKGPLLAHCFRRNCMKDAQDRRKVEQMLYYGLACVDSDCNVTSIQVPEDSMLATKEPQNDSSTEVTLEGMRKWVPGFNWCIDGMCPDIEEYLVSRGLTNETLELFKLGWGEVTSPRTGTLINHGVPCLLIPVIVNNRVVGMQARCPDKLLGDTGLRYWTHPGMRKSSFVYNIDKARQIGLAVVCEGVFDVFHVGATGVCIFGHTMSTGQKSLIGTVGGGIILLPDTDKHTDFDTVKEARSLAAAWNSINLFRHGAHVVVLSGKDAGEMSTTDIWCQIIDQVDKDMRKYIIIKIKEGCV